MSTPQPPQGVYLIRRGRGARVPLELDPTPHYDEDGMCRWTVVTEVTYRRGDILHIDVLPPRTSVVFPPLPGPKDDR